MGKSGKKNQSKLRASANNSNKTNQREHHHDQEEAPSHHDTHETRAPPPPHNASSSKNYDPDGSHDIHRGFTNKEARHRRHELVQLLADKTRQKRRHTKAAVGDDDGILDQDDDLMASLGVVGDKQQKQKQKQKPLAKDKILAQKLEIKETKQVEAKIAAMDAVDVLQTGAVGLLQAEHDMERTSSLSQVELKRQLLHSDQDDAARHIYDLALESPHGLKYDRSGRYALLYSSSQNPQGHIAIMDCHTRALVPNGEFYVQQHLTDACFLHNAQMLATASANHPVAIYDATSGAEIHSLSDHLDAMALEFLPYHFLLASVGRTAMLKYTDTSTGQLISTHRTRGIAGSNTTEGGLRAGNPVVMRQNPFNAVLHMGHTNGTVTLWSPASSKYLVKFLCHKGASVLSLAMDLGGRTMVTGGADRQVKVWDLRYTYREVHSYYTVAGPPTSIDISQRNVLGIGHAGHATFWSPSALKVKEKNPYMHHMIPQGGPIETLRFRPFEDVCGIGHAKGISSIVIPGSGEPNLDTAEHHTNPFQDSRQRREAEVRALLDKLSPDMITLHPETIGGMEETNQFARLEQIRDKQELANSKTGVVKKQKTKKRGRSKIQLKLRRKHKNIIDQQTLQLREAREQEKALEKSANGRSQNNNSSKGGKGRQPDTPKAQPALKRFF